MRRILRLFRRVLVVAFLVVAAAGIYSMLFGLPDYEGVCDTTICCADCESAAVARIIDGDTLVINRSFRPDQRVRLYGVDTPEVGERCFTEATDRLRELAKTSVRLQPGPRSEDIYDRKLYYLYTRSGESIDEILVREGLGVAWTRDGQHRDALVRMERQARSGGTGCLW